MGWLADPALRNVQVGYKGMIQCLFRLLLEHANKRMLGLLSARSCGITYGIRNDRIVDLSLLLALLDRIK